MEALNPLAIRALNHLIQGESWAQARLISHSGAQLLIDSGFFVLRLGIDERGLFQPGDKALQADVSITLPSDLPARFLFNRDTLFSSVKLGGSADIAESLAFVLRNLRWDAEADLAQLVGDIPARRLARLGQTLAAAIQDAVGRVAENFSEYAVEESGMLAANRDVTAFGGAVSCLRDDVARLEKRISRL
jgi:ubiquinone biosynthesis protein UbiJ